MALQPEAKPEAWRDVFLKCKKDDESRANALIDPRLDKLGVHRCVCV